MKHFAALTLLLVAFAFGAQAQCTPDQSITQPGFYPAPDSLPCVERGVLFDTVLQFKNFSTVNAADFGIPFPVTVTVNWVRVDSIGGLPNGLSYACNPSSCQFPGGSNGCINFTGTTSSPAGQYPLVIYATINADVPGFGNFEEQGTSDDLGYSVFLNVIEQGAPCPAPTVTLANGPLFSCPGQGALILLDIDTGGAVAPFTYAWSPSANLNDATSATPLATVTSATTFTVTVTDANGYDFTTDVFVDVDNTPAPAADFNFTITGNSVEFTNLSANSTTVSWNFGNGSTSTTQNPTQTYASASDFTVTLIAFNNCGSDTATKVVTITSITDLLGKDLNVTVYPNPTKGLFSVSLNGIAATPAQVLVYDMQGRKVATAEMQNNGATMGAIVDLTGNANGIYIVKVVSGNQTSTHKLAIH